MQKTTKHITGTPYTYTYAYTYTYIPQTVLALEGFLLVFYSNYLCGAGLLVVAP